MRLSCHQPYFFPYLGYYALLANCDLFVWFDISQYTRHSWMNRNRILGVHSGWEYITVPVRKHPLGTPLNEVRIADELPWRRTIERQLERYRRAPCYRLVMDLVRSLLDHRTDSLCELNLHTTHGVCDYLSLGGDRRVYSDLRLALPALNAPDEWGLNLALALGATVYVNAPGGRDFYDGAKYRDRGVELQFLASRLPAYDQARPEFEPGLSILDVLMFNDAAAVRQMLQEVDHLR